MSPYKYIRKKIFGNAPELIKKYCTNVIKTRIQNAFSLSKNITYLGKGELIEENDSRLYNLSSSSKFYSRCVKDGCIYATSQKINKRSNNSVAQLSDDTFVLIIKFIIDFDLEKQLIIYKQIKTREHNFCNGYKSLRIVTDVDNNIAITDIINLKSVCVCYEILDTMYICTLPNLVSY